MYAVLLSAGLVFIAELGDKSQLMSMTFATRYRTRTVIIGAGLGCALTTFVSAFVGNTIGDNLPQHAVRVAAGVLFLIFAALTLRNVPSDDAPPVERKRGGAAVLVVAVAFILAELGDKTMLATMTLSTQYHWVLIWIGSLIGELTAIVLAVFAGRALLQILPIRTVHIVSAALFAAVGVWMLIG
ncbi:putative Ca2+/H+ antiporter (TMEM165/GDT1 family) [Aeromicrobium panaciterrae]|uniref:GDT1 family protein n=1 Tax=Aeromicrobium panaciterrae TaxID=363861 RepID=A0ABU1UQ04_9ACTN|nr:TMEM165/GDT1 family protein [Aeromicrobium panaciterrae]MDR7087261.1 putative Ca2+/H+ antiporter (TMEM165/GDT1 family) [Aeromicrobium panaciterrae]